jgi:hypothetical protein
VPDSRSLEGEADETNLTKQRIVTGGGRGCALWYAYQIDSSGIFAVVPIIGANCIFDQRDAG